MLRYHPRAGTVDPQGRKYKPANQWATPPELQRAIELTFLSKTEIFASPLNCSMEPGVTYCTAYPEDSAFGAVFDAFRYRLTGSCIANPEYEPGDMRKAILHALASSTDTPTPLLVVMVLPVWEDTPWSSAAIRSHPNMETLIQIPAGHMRFVPAHKQTDGDTTSLTPAKWPVELVLISNEAGKQQFIDRARIAQILTPALCRVCQLSPDQIQFFPKTLPRTSGPPTTPAGSPPRPIPTCPATLAPHTPPLGTPGQPGIAAGDEYPTATLAHLPRFYMPQRPLHMVELCGGIATGLEAALKAGLTIASYTWADIDPDAHTATAHRLKRLQHRHPLLLPEEATTGWDTRLPMDTRTITPALFTQAFPAGVDIIMTSPPMLPQHLPRTHRGNGQPAHATLLKILRLIRHLASTQRGGVGFIWDTPDRSPLPAHILAVMGPSTVLNAPKCGSGAHRPTQIWQNWQN